MYFKNADIFDFEVVYKYITELWSYNVYDQNEIYEVYQHVLNDPNSFAFLLVDCDGTYKGVCHGTFFDTFWLSGKTCYLSSIITNSSERCKGYGHMLLDHFRELASSRGCKAIILDSGFSRTTAHRFYEHYGFTKNCYGFDLLSVN